MVPNARRRLAAVAAALVTVVAAWATPATADHIRAMTVRQIAGYPAPDYTVTLRVEFEMSGNCCGGAFTWHTGEVPDRIGSVPDGIVGGNYVGDQVPTAGAFLNGDPFTWSRNRPAMPQNSRLVRIDITYDYAAPGPYLITWHDCCPDSQNVTPIVVGTGITPKHLLVPDSGTSAIDDAMAASAIPTCDLVAIYPAELCYEKLDWLTLSTQTLHSYSAIVVPSNLDNLAVPAAYTTLGAHPELADWLESAPHGIAAFAQRPRAGWSWLPKNGETLTHAATLLDAVTVTVRGMTHTSHLNQTPLPVSTLAGWGPSVLHTFTDWPSYFDTALGTALAETSPWADVVALGAEYAGGPGCEVITGQPVDAAAANGQQFARVLFRSMIEYALTCVDDGYVPA